MKKVVLFIISLISIFAFNRTVYAASGSLSVSSGNVYVGDSFTVTANISSAAAWNVHTSTSGPVSGCIINQADASSDATDINKSFSATCTATGEGTITIVLSGDVTSSADGNAVNISGSRSVTVSKRPTPSNNNTNNSTTTNTNNNNNNNNPLTNNSDNKSSNHNIKDLSVDGYELTKIDSNNYTLTVPNDVTSINIKATPEDSKAKIEGTGSHNLTIGDNNIEIITTAENGSQNKILIKVIRKDGYYLEDLDTILKNNKIDDINIIIKSDTIITTQELEKIKSSKKTIKLNCYDDNNNLKYSWIIDGSKLKSTSDLLTTISNDSKNKKDILKLSNYADGLFIELKQGNKLPTGVKIKLYVGYKYENKDLVNVYSYTKNSSKLKLVNNKVKVNDGYIQFNISDASDYLITMSKITSPENNTNQESNSSSMALIITLGILIFLVIGIILILILRKNKKVKNNSLDDEPVMIKNNIDSNTNNTELI